MRSYQPHPFEAHSPLHPCTPIVHDNGTVLTSSEISALLDLVVPSNNVPPPTPIETVLVNSYGSSGYSSPRFLEPAPPLPMHLFEEAHRFDFRDGAPQSFVASREDTSILPVTLHVPPFLNAVGVIEPLTSFLRANPAFSAEFTPPAPQQSYDHLCTLVTPLELLSGTTKPPVQAVKKRLNGLDTNSLADRCRPTKQSNGGRVRHGSGKCCIAFGCTYQAQSKGRCKRHGGGQRCKVKDCGRSSQTGGLCRTHGGAKLCVAPGCKKGAQRYGKCSAHASRKCTADGCMNVIHSAGFCARHKKQHWN